MDSSAKKLPVFLCITLLSSLDTHARDSHFFNKIPSTTNQQQQNFLPENDNSYSLYGNYGQNPPSKNYVTQFTEERTFTTKPKQEGEPEFNNNNYYYGFKQTGFRSAAANHFRPQGMSDTRFVENGKYYYDDSRYLYGNNANEFNSMGGYQNQEDFQDEDNMP